MRDACGARGVRIAAPGFSSATGGGGAMLANLACSGQWRLSDPTLPARKNGNGHRYAPYK
ncbi:hypothetical protein GCM10009757_45780 [Streptomyces cheonanensis]|uniref:Uncharacterized protein n=1 Tax=Streptomyces cheonanensis TaxID=312720 RepID=A0ABN2VLU1_9ACTN